MKITYNNFIEKTIYIIIAILLIRYGSKTLAVSVFLSWLIFFMWINKRNKEQILKYQWVIIYFFLLSFLFIIQIQRPTNESFSFIFPSYLTFLLLPIVFPMYEILCLKKTDFLHNINKIGILFLVFKSFIWLVYNFFNINLGFSALGGGIGWHRVVMGRLLDRMSGTYLDGFLFSFALMKVIDKKTEKKYIYILELLFLMFYAGVVYQSRTQVIFYIFVLLISILYLILKNKDVFTSIVVIIVSLMSLIILRNVLFNLYSSFSIYSDNGGSTIIRMQEYTFFPIWWKSTSIWWGFGIYNEANPIIYNGTRLFISDVGIIMQLYQFGIIGFLVSIIPLFSGLIRLIQDLFRKRSILNVFMVTFISYILISSANFNVYYGNAFPIVPLYISLILFNNKYNEF